MYPVPCAMEEFSNAFISSKVTTWLLLRIIVVKLVQLLKAYPSIEAHSGRSTVVKLVQPLKASSPIEVHLRRSIVVKLVQPSKA